MRMPNNPCRHRHYIPWAIPALCNNTRSLSSARANALQHRSSNPSTGPLHSATKAPVSSPVFIPASKRRPPLPAQRHPADHPGHGSWHDEEMAIRDQGSPWCWPFADSHPLRWQCYPCIGRNLLPAQPHDDGTGWWGCYRLCIAERESGEVVRGEQREEKSILWTLINK